MRYKIEYWSNDASDAHPFVLTVTDTGVASLVVGSNGDAPGPAPVGVFAGKPPAATVDALLRAATAPALAAAAGPVGPTNPGELVRKLTVSVDGQPPVARHVNESAPADPAFEAAEKAALMVAAQVRPHGQQALSAQTTFRFSGGPSVEIAVKLSNVGTDPVAVPHPDRWTDRQVLINVTARRNDLPVAQMSNEHQMFLALSKTQLSGVTPAPAATASVIVLPPGKDVTFAFSAQLPLATGNYDVWLAFDTPLCDAQGAELLRTEMVSAKQQRRAG